MYPEAFHAGIMDGKALPYDEEVNFLKSAGNLRTYINTGISPTLNMTMTFGYKQISSASSYFIGSDGGGNTRFSWAHSDIGLYEARLGEYSGMISSHFIINEINTASISTATQKCLLNGNIVFNGSMTSLGAKTPILLFADNTASNTPNTSNTPVIISFVRIETDGSMLIDLIPVLKSGVPCMYDRIGKKFYYNVVAGHQFGYQKKDGTVVEPY